MNPFFFGTSEKQLFGVYHPPERHEVSDGAVVLCPSFGHEYIAAHNSIHSLAAQLSRAGFHVLRFDYYGCGDSAGSMDEVTVDQWVEDVGTAIEEVRDTSGARRVCVIGLRLGAALAALAATRARAAGDKYVHGAVLWDPVVRGGAYLDELTNLQQKWVGAMYVAPPRHISGAEGPEVMGFRLPSEFQDQLRAVDLHELDGLPAVHTLIIDQSGDEACVSLKQRLDGHGSGVTQEVNEAGAAWFGEGWQTIALPPTKVLQRITQWVTEAYQ